MRPSSCPETSVSNYHYTLRNTPKGRGCHIHRGGNLKSPNSLYFGLDGSGFEFRQGQRFFSSPKRPNRLWDPPNLLISGYRRSLPEIKRLRCAYDIWNPSSADVKNEWSYTSSPPIFLLGVDRDSFTIFIVPCQPDVYVPLVVWGIYLQTCNILFSRHYLTLRRLTSYIYGAPILDVSRSHTTTQHSR